MLLLLVHAIPAGRVLAHPTVPTVILAEVTPADGAARVHVMIEHDTLAYALNDTSALVTDPQMYELLRAPPEELDAALLDGRERFAAAFQILADGSPVHTELVDSPTLDKVELWKSYNPTLRLPCKMEFVVDAVLPPGTKDMTIHMPYILGDAILTVKRTGTEPTFIQMSPGEDSPAIDVGMVTALPPEQPDIEQPAIEPPAPERPAPGAVDMLDVAGRSTARGFLSVLPWGWAPALLVLCLVLLSPRVGDVIWQVGAFTLGHTLTLALAAFHVIEAPAAIVGPTIAATVVFVGVENVFARRYSRWRLLVVFNLGLVHGFGYAASLPDAGRTPGAIAAALVGFSLGVEGAYAIILGAALALVGRIRDTAWYRTRVLVPVSAVIAGVALVGTVWRLL